MIFFGMIVIFVSNFAYESLEELSKIKATNYKKLLMCILEFKKSNGDITIIDKKC